MSHWKEKLSDSFGSLLAAAYEGDFLCQNVPVKAGRAHGWRKT